MEEPGRWEDTLARARRGWPLTLGLLSREVSVCCSQATACGSLLGGLKGLRQAVLRNGPRGTQSRNRTVRAQAWKPRAAGSWGPCGGVTFPLCPHLQAGDPGRASVSVWG